MRIPAVVSVGCLSAILAGACLTTASAPPMASAADASAVQLEEAARRLGDPNARVRDEAAAALRAAGPAAEPALHAVAESGDPEASRRARGLLQELRQAAPEEPAEDEPAELAQYRDADRETKLQLIQQFGGGGYRAGLLARLWAAEPEGELRAAMFRSMMQSPALSATALVSAGNAPAAERLLEAALAERNVEAAAPYAALAALRGHVQETLTQWSARASKEGDDATLDTVRTYLHRAAGDPAAAVGHARLTGDRGLIEETLTAAGDWRGLAEAVRARPDPIRFPRQLGLLAGAFHLAGDDAAFDEVAQRMAKLADPDTADDAAHVMLLAGRSEPALRLLAEHGRHALHFEILAAQDRWDAAFELLASKEAARDEQALWLRVTAAEQLHDLGEGKRAGELLERVALENEQLKSHRILGHLGTAARRMGRTELAWEYFLAAVNREEEIEEEPNWSAWQAFHDEDAEVDGPAVWRLLAERSPDNPAEKLFAQVRSVVEQTMPVAELTALAAAGGDNPHAAYEANLHRGVAQRMKDAGDEPGAVAYLEASAKAAPTPEYAAALWQRGGDWAADKKDWAKAATWYGRAWNADRTRPAPLYLRGWALRQAGWNVRAGELLNLAHVLPLADAGRRFEAMQVLHRRGMAAELAREAAVVLRTARPDVLPADVAVRHTGDLALRAGDPLAAAAAFERSLLNFMGTFEFADAAYYVRVPHTIRRNRAKGLLAKGDVKAAEREIAACRANIPGDVMLVIDVVPEFERLGDKARADALYAEAMAAQEAILAKYPDSASHHNSAAWLAVILGRDADKAMQHARRAVALRPDNASCVDTLAEAQFRRGEIDEAINTMNRCIELEPKSPRHREQIERFEAAKRGEQRPMPPG